MWVFDDETGRMVHRPTSYVSLERARARACTLPHQPPACLHRQVPGLYKIFDELLVNAADNKMRDQSMTIIRVQLDSENGCISVYNNGARCCAASAVPSVSRKP